MQLFGVTRAMAILKMFELMCLVVAAPIVIFNHVRVNFHSMYFDVLKGDVTDAKKDARQSADRADKAVRISYAMMKSSSQVPPHDAQDASDDH